MPETNVTVSAGGVVLNREGKVLIVSQNGTSWSLPKGHIDPGEDPIEAAVREIKEETGITQLEFLRFLGSYARHKMALRSGEDKGEWKVLVFFLFSTKQNEFSLSDPRHPEARWSKIEDVEDLLTHPKDKAFFKSIRPMIK